MPSRSTPHEPEKALPNGSTPPSARRTPTAGDGAAPLSPRALLDEKGSRLLARLAASEVSLRLTARHFPHVVNRLGGVWTSPGLFERAMQELLLTSRAGRNGFPIPVVRELLRFREFQERWVRQRRKRR